MITVYVDDSGTDPRQKIAIASAVIVESRRVESLDKEVAGLFADEGFSYFHTA